MKTSKIQIGQQVISSKRGNGTITKIITKSTGYVEVTYDNGVSFKEMAFNLTDENGITLKSKPESETSGMSKGEKKRHKDTKAIIAFENQSNLDKVKSAILWINGTVYGDIHSHAAQWCQTLFLIVEVDAKQKKHEQEELVIGIMNTIKKTYKVSEKQAYVIAKCADDLGIKYEDIN